MKSVTFNPSTNQFEYQATTAATPPLQVNDVLVEVEACALNPVDAKIIDWKGMVGTEMNAHWVVGLDVCGRIKALGAAVKGWKVGDRVLYHGNMFRPHGGLASLAVHDADTLLSVADEIQAHIAAAMPCAGWTAWRALVDKLKVNAQDRLLVIGGSGGVGSFAVQIAKNVLQCPQVIAVCSTSNIAFVKSLGADVVIDYRKEDILERVKALTDGEGVTKAFDTIGGDNDVVAANALAFDGEMLELVDVVRPQDYDQPFQRGMSFHQLALGAGHGFGDRGKASIITAGQGFMAAYIRGQIRLPQVKVIPLSAAPLHLQAFHDKKTVGKVVVDMKL